jgi:predicted small lipoprotein YifL
LLLGDVMKRILSSFVLVTLAFSLAACAPPPPPPSADYSAPPKKRLDAKTQLETGKTY